MESIIIHPKNQKQLAALKAVAKAMEVDFETNESPYDPEFVSKILEGEKDIKEGKGVKIDLKDLWSSLHSTGSKRFKPLENIRQ